MSKRTLLFIIAINAGLGAMTPAHATGCAAIAVEPPRAVVETTPSARERAAMRNVPRWLRTRVAQKATTGAKVCAVA